MLVEGTHQNYFQTSAVRENEIVFSVNYTLGTLNLHRTTGIFETTERFSLPIPNVYLFNINYHINCANVSSDYHLSYLIHVISGSVTLCYTKIIYYRRFQLLPSVNVDLELWSSPYQVMSVFSDYWHNYDDTRRYTYIREMNLSGPAIVCSIADL